MDLLDTTIIGNQCSVIIILKLHTWSPVAGIGPSWEGGTACGKVEQLLSLCVVHVAHNTPEHPRNGNERGGGGLGGREEGENKVV